MNIQELEYTLVLVRRRLREDTDDEKEGKTNEMSGVTRWKVRYKRASTNLYRWVEPNRDVYYVRKW